MGTFPNRIIIIQQQLKCEKILPPCAIQHTVLLHLLTVCFHRLAAFLVHLLTYFFFQIPTPFRHFAFSWNLPFFVVFILRYRHSVSLGSVAVMCQFCKPPQTLEATKGCADCRANFCNECFKLYHPWGTPRAQHEHILPTLNFRPKVHSIFICIQEKL